MGAASAGVYPTPFLVVLPGEEHTQCEVTGFLLLRPSKRGAAVGGQRREEEEGEEEEVGPSFHGGGNTHSKSHRG